MNIHLQMSENAVDAALAVLLNGISSGLALGFLWKWFAVPHFAPIPLFGVVGITAIIVFTELELDGISIARIKDDRFISFIVRQQFWLGFMAGWVLAIGWAVHFFI